MIKGWEKRRFGDIAIFPPKIKMIKGNLYPNIPMEAVEAGIKYVKPLLVKKLLGGATKFEEGDTIFARINPSLDNGKIAQAKNLLGKPGFGSTEFFIFRGKQGISDTDFIYYLSKTLNFRNHALNSMVGASGRQRADAKFVRIFEFNLPPLKAQQKIAAILSAYDDLIENNLKRIKLLEEQAQQTYTEWFVRLKFPGYEDAKFDKDSGLPVGWEISTLGEFAKTSSGGTPSRKKESEYYKNGTIPWVKTGELKNFMLIDSKEKITELGLSKSSAKLFPKKTVLLAMYGNTIGETTFLTFEASTNQACCGFLVKNKVYKSYFLHQFLLNQKKYILNFRMGAAQENISQGIIQGIKFKKPSKDVLLEFEKQIAPKYDLIEIIYSQNQRLKEARDILLPRLMSGIIAVDSLEVG